jgi:hypothetical protein
MNASRSEGILSLAKAIVTASARHWPGRGSSDPREEMRRFEVSMYA